MNILPCPFCNDPGRYTDDGDCCYVECTGCNARASAYVKDDSETDDENRRQAIFLWNVRPMLLPKTARRIPPIEGMTGAEEVRACAGWCDSASETALDPFTADELLQCWRAYRLSGWEFTLSDWTPLQRTQAARYGIVPQWYSRTEMPAQGVHWTGLPAPAAKKGKAKP